MAEFESVGFFGGKKFLWDGESREKKEEAREATDKYGKENFETHIVEKDGVFGVYTRRVAAAVVAEGQH